MKQFLQFRRYLTGSFSKSKTQFSIQKDIIFLTLLLPVLLFAQQYKIMPLGDSITHGEWGSSPLGGYRDDLALWLDTDGVSFDMVGTQNDGVGVYPYHEGHPGWETDQITHKINEYLRFTNPDVILLHIGTNDINCGEDAAYVKKATDELLTEIYLYDPTVTIFIASIIPRKEALNVEHTNLAPLLKALVEQRQNQGYTIFYCPVNEIFNAHSDPERYLYDNLHPTNNGYNLIAQGFFKPLMDYLGAINGIITDNFDRSVITEYWYSKGEYELNNYQIRSADQNSERYIAVYGYQDDPTAVSVTFGADINPDGNGDSGVAVRLSDGSDRPDGYAVIKESATGDLVLYHVERGQLTDELDRTMALKTQPIQDDTFKVAFITDASKHTFDCYINGRFDGRLTDPNMLEGRYGNQHAGVILTGTENNRLDNFTFSYTEQQLYNGPGGMQLVQGDGQKDVVNEIASKELVVKVQDINGTALIGVPVSFFVSDGDGSVWQATSSGLNAYEAECSELAAPMAKASSLEAAGTGYIGLPTSATPYQGSAVLQVEVAQAGTYKLWGRVKGSDSNTHSLGVKMDGGTENSWQFSGNLWQWSGMGQYSLTAGRHTITFVGKENGSFVDRLILTTSTGFSPETSILGSSDFSSSSSGQASAKVILPKKAGTIKVQAYLPDFPSLAQSFSLTATPDVPSIMALISGDTQFGKPNEQLPQPLTVQITDQYGNYSENADVTFEVTQGNGTLSAAQPMKTDAQGIAKVYYTFGTESGENLIKVTCPGYISSGVTFSVTAEKTLFAIRGQVSYFADQTPVPNVDLAASGGMTAEVYTDQSGNYVFGAIPKNTDFKITPTRELNEADAREVIDLYNSALIMRHALGIATLDADKQKAADVNQDGMINSYDAANLARFVVELPAVSEDIKVGNWYFVQSSRSYSNIIVDLNNQNYTGYLLGDVSGRWSSEQQSLLAKEVNGNYGWRQEFIASAGDTIVIPFTVDQTDILACDLHYEINPEQVEFIDVRKTRISDSFTIFHNMIDNRLQIGMFSPYLTTETGEFVNLRFRLLTDEAAETAVHFEKYRINDQPYVNVSTDVPLNISAGIPKTFALEQNYPNPFSASGSFSATKIEYLLPKTCYVEISIYNLLGQEVNKLVAQELPAGKHQIQWNGTDVNGMQTAAGVYIYCLKTGNKQITKRMMKIK